MRGVRRAAAARLEVDENLRLAVAVAVEVAGRLLAKGCRNRYAAGTASRRDAK